MRSLRTIIPMLILMAAAPATARIWTVPGDAETIAAGLALAQVGDTVQVARGTYMESDIVLIEGVTLRGDPTDPAATIIDASYAGRVLSGTDLSSATLVEGLTLQHGLATGAAGLLCQTADVTVRNCIFRDNLSGFDGGAIVCNESAGLIEDCEFIDNTASGGSGGAITCRRATPTIRRCSFRGNSAFGWGGAVYCSGDAITAVMTKCEFVENSARVGGALAINGAAPSVDDSEFLRNRADESGGALYLSLGGAVTVSDSRFEGNSSPVGKIATVGGGCSAVLRCTNADASLIQGVGNVVWDDEACDQVSTAAMSWGAIKALFR